MQTRTFGRLGWQVSEIGHGLWGAGGWTGSDDEESIAAIHRSMALGCNFFDTALAYGLGKSERLLAKAMHARGADAPRLRADSDEATGATAIRIATKIPPKNGKWPALASYKLDDVFPADYIRECTETSLANLQLSSVDLQQFHVWSDAWADDDRWQSAVTDLKNEGLVRAFGISVNRWEPTSAFKAFKTGLIDSVQVVYNIFDQDAADELFPMCRELGIAVIVRVPFDEGSLTGTLTPESTWPQGDFRNIYFAPEKLGETLRRVDLVKADLPPGMTLPELALRFILANPDVATIIPGMRRPKHVDANLAVSDGKPLNPETLARLARHRWHRGYVLP
jgi:aryl-alcohol dehydrogenase-like predicted oxidoreductase